MENSGRRMKELRENMNIGQEELASYLDISQSYLSQIESGNRNLTLSILNKLCALYGCSENYLLCKDNNFSPKKFAFRSKNLSAEDLKCVASINKIHSNLEYLIKKLDNSEG